MLEKAGTDIVLPWGSLSASASKGKGGRLRGTISQCFLIFMTGWLVLPITLIKRSKMTHANTWPQLKSENKLHLTSIVKEWAGVPWFPCTEKSKDDKGFNLKLCVRCFNHSLLGIPLIFWLTYLLSHWSVLILGDIWRLCLSTKQPQRSFKW